MSGERRTLGNAGERLAERALVERGWRVISRNARTRYGEIDLVCADGRTLVFVEVKTRAARSFVSAVEAVTRRKQARMQRLAQAWLALHGVRGAPCRLALAALTVGPTGTNVQVLDITD